MEPLRNGGEQLAKFLLTAISDHQSSEMYQTAEQAVLYDKRRNPTIEKFQKVLYTLSGRAVPDHFRANFKLKSNFLNRFVTHENQYLLGNGVTLENNDDKLKLGKNFDTRLQEAGHSALVQGVSFGFWNMDHLEVFQLKEFVPLWDEETGQHYGEIQKGSTFYQIWMEDKDSIETKLAVMSKYDIGGVAAWKLGYETPDIWDKIAVYMKN